jgi:hypothetical protein
VYFIENAMPPLMSDPNFLAYARSHPAEFDKVQNMGAMVSQHRREIINECGTWVLPK